MKKDLSLPLFVLMGWLLFESPVYAYLDPGAGSMLLQILVGGFAAVGMIGKLYWHKVSALFRARGADGDESE